MKLERGQEREENTCRIYVTQKQEVGILERVRGSARGRQEDRARDLGVEINNKKYIENAIINHVSLHAS